MKERSKVILAAAALMLAACAFAVGVGRMEYVAADLAKRTTTVAWTWTDLADNAVRLSLTRNGEDFPTAGWGGTLFIGDGALGCAIAGTPSGYNELLFDVGRENVPTNGKYAVQILATNTARRVEEWVRGTLTVRANPAADGMPTNWSAYADIARKVTPYIDAQGILSDPANADALWGAVSNRTDELIQAVSPTPDFTTNNTELVETIETTAPAPGNYSVVSNRAMNASGNFLAVDGPFLWESEKAIKLDNGYIEFDNTATGGSVLLITYQDVIFGYSNSAYWQDIIDAANAHAEGLNATSADLSAAAVAATNYVNAATNAALSSARAYTDAATNAVPRDFLPLAGGTMRGNINMGGSYGGADATDSAFLEFIDWRFGNGVLGLGFGIYQYDGEILTPSYLFNGLRWYDEYGDNEDVMTREDLADALSSIDFPVLDLEDYATHAQATNAAMAVTSAAISTNNAAFVEAVLAAPLTGASASDLAEIGEYGSYGTIGAALLALIAGLAALRRNKQDSYSFATITPDNGILTVAPYTGAAYTPTAQDTALTVGVAALQSGKLRDCLLTLDCTQLSTAPQLTFGVTGQTFSPANGDESNTSAEAGTKNVFYISEFAAGAFFVARQTAL